MSPPPAAPRWPPPTTFVLCLLGLADSAYQAHTDLTSGGLLGCSARADACVLVQHSVYAHVLGIPVAVLGVVFYAFMTAICSPPAWRSARPAVHRARRLRRRGAGEAGSAPGPARTCAGTAAMTASGHPS
jgi:Vitamin K epoxide reductase family